MKDEIILYRPNEKAEHIEVRLEDDSVWLNRQQLSILFERDVKTIGKHIVNVLNEELAGLPVVAKFATTASDGKVYQTEHYNLEMIISIGYRVKSQKGIHLGASLKDFGKKWFAFSKLESKSVEGVLNTIMKLV